MAAIEGCPNTNEKPGGGAIFKYVGDDLFSDVCPNMKVVALRQRLTRIDPQLLKVRYDATTPLYQYGKCDRTQENLLLTQLDWKLFLSHFKWVLGCKATNFFPRIVTDNTLKQVYMGEASLRSRSTAQRDEGELPIFNSLEDLLASPDLVIIRVGFVVYFNRAMSSILMEALLLRDGLGKPTWIVEAAGQHFTPWVKTEHGVTSGMPCCDIDVRNFVDARFESLQLGDPSTVEPTSEQEGEEVSLPGSQMVEEEPSGYDAEEPPADPEASIIDSLTRRKGPNGKWRRS